MEKVQNRAPRLSLGQDVEKSEAPHNSQRYSVSFERNTVKIRPALDEKDAALLIAHTRIYSNYRNGMIDAIQGGSHDAPSLWYGYVWSWTDGSDRIGTYTVIEVTTDPYSKSSG